MADGGLAPHLGGPAVGAVRVEHADRGPLHQDPRLAPGRGQRPRRAQPRRPGRRRCVRRRRQRLDRRSRRLALAAVRRRGAEGGARRRARRVQAGAVDRGRHPGVAEGPGLAARRQLRQRGLPDAGRREARRPGPDRRALPAVRPEDAGDHAERPQGVRWSGRHGRGPAPFRHHRLRHGRLDTGDGRGRRRPGGLARRGRRERQAPRDRRARRRRRDRRRSPGRLEQLGRGAVEDDDEDGAARERPAPRHRDALGLVHQRAPLPHDHGRLPVRCRRRVLPRRARGHPGPQREDRLGRDERRSGRGGPVHDRARPGQPGQLRRRGRVDPVRGPPRDDQGRRRRRRPARRPHDA